MAMEQRVGQVNTTEDLLARVPMSVPFDDGVFHQPTSFEEHYRFNPSLIDQHSHFQWDQLFNLGEALSVRRM